MHVFLMLFLCSVSQSGSTPTSSTTSSTLDPERRTLTVGMANMVLSLLSSAWFPLDLSAHQDALLLCGNLLAGGHLTHFQNVNVYLMKCDCNL